MALTPQNVINLLQAPETLLRRCYISIGGGVGNMGPNGQAPIATFSVAVDNEYTKRGFTTGISGLFGRQKDRPEVLINKLPVPIIPAPPDHFNAYYIPMVGENDVIAGSSHYVLPTGGNTRIAITSKLDGCVFSMGSDGNGGVLVSHVRPTVGGTLEERQARANIAGRIGFGHGITQIRHGVNYDLNVNKVTVIGQLNHGRWRFYMQRHIYENDDYVINSALRVVRI